MKVEKPGRRALPAGAGVGAWTAADGLPIRLLDWPQPEGARARGSLIFAGGRGDFLEKYLEPLCHWHARGWNVASFEWRGQGGSRGDIVGGHVESFDPLVADAASLVANWRATRPGPHVAVAHSMGGHLLLRLLAERRPGLDAAVLLAPMIGINASPIPQWLAPRIASGLCALGRSRGRPWKGAERPAPPGSSRQAFLTSCADRYADELWWREREPGYNLGPPTWGWLRAAYRSIATLTPERLRAISTPLLILASQGDRLVSAAATRRAARFLPDVRLHIYPDAAHEILRESDAVRIDALERIDTFLHERAPA